jgi:hypothetical protein
MVWRTPARVSRTRWSRAVALLAWATLWATPAAWGQGAIAAKPHAAALASKPKFPVWALTRVGFAHVPNYEGLPASRAQKSLSVHFRVTSIPVRSTWPLGIVHKQTPLDVDLAYGSPIELQVSDGIAPRAPPQTPPPPPPPPPQPPPQTPQTPPPIETSQPPVEPPTPSPETPPPEIVTPERLGFIRDLEGDEATTAQAYLEATGFRVGDWLWTPSDRPRGILVTQAPKNVRAPLGSAVIFWVSAGPPAVPMIVLGVLAAAVVGGGGLALKRGVDRRRLRVRRAAVHVSADRPQAAEAPSLLGRAQDRHALNIRVERAPGPPRLAPKDPP